MADWQPGDLALCIADGRRTNKGRVYTVHAVAYDSDRCGCGHYLPYGYAPALWLAGVGQVDSETGCEPWARAIRFVKITPGSEITGKEAEKRRPVKTQVPA